MKKLIPLVILLSLTACDYVDQRDQRQERASRAYQGAMTDYRAGRISQAIAGFRKVCQAEPGNASARFQLACLLQDAQKDFLDAYCAYREYLNLNPDSDKAKLAHDRLAMCEKELAVRLAEKHSLINGNAFSEELAAARKAKGDAERKCLKLEEDLARAMQRIAALSQEGDRLKAALREDANENAGPSHAADIKTAQDLLDDESGENEDRISHSADIAQLRREENAERAISSMLLPAREPDEKPAAESKSNPPPAAASEERGGPHEERPEYYVIQAGDTLYRIAMRFYGTKTAWKKIRDANKTQISVDGRVRQGMRIRLP